MLVRAAIRTGRVPACRGARISGRRWPSERLPCVRWPPADRPLGGQARWFAQARWTGPLATGAQARRTGRTADSRWARSAVSPTGRSAGSPADRTVRYPAGRTASRPAGRTSRRASGPGVQWADGSDVLLVGCPARRMSSGRVSGGPDVQRAGCPAGRMSGRPDRKPPQRIGPLGPTGRPQPALWADRSAPAHAGAGLSVLCQRPKLCAGRAVRPVGLGEPRGQPEVRTTLNDDGRAALPAPALTVVRGTRRARHAWCASTRGARHAWCAARVVREHAWCASTRGARARVVREHAACGMSRFASHGCLGWMPWKETIGGDRTDARRHLDVTALARTSARPAAEQFRRPAQPAARPYHPGQERNRPDPPPRHRPRCR